MLLLLVKPAARRRKKYASVVDSLLSQGACELIESNEKSLRREVQNYISNTDEQVTVVACGGDGTAHLLVNAVFDLPVTFAVIPMGTGNDFSRCLGIRNTAQACQTLETGSPTLMDVVSIRHREGFRYFLGIASCGFDAQVNERANSYRGPKGTAKYVAALLAELKRLAPLELQVTREKELQVHNLTLLAVANTPSYGGGMRVAPDASAYDGSLDVVQVAAVSRMTLLRVFPKVFRGSHVTHPAVKISSAKTLGVSGNDFPIYADGEFVGRGPATFTVHPCAVQVLHPA